MCVIAVAQGSGERLCNSEMTVAACMKTSERVQTRWVETRSVKGAVPSRTTCIVGEH